MTDVQKMDRPLDRNPLLDFSGLPRFAEFDPAFVAPALDALLAAGRNTLGEVIASQAAPTWESVVAPLEDANERIARAWGQVAHLHAVLDSPALREVYNEVLPRVTQYWTELAQNTGLFARYRALHASPAFERLTPARRRIVENALRDFHLGGAELHPEPRARFAEIQDALARHGARFSENLLDATNAHAQFVTVPAEVAGIPQDVLAEARDAAQKAGQAGWKFTLHAPSYLPVMQYAEHRPLREALYRAYATRASELGKQEFDNTGLIADIVALRAEEARLLGHRNYGEVSLARKMASSPEEVTVFLADLARRARLQAERDAAELAAFAHGELGIPVLEAWDWGFAAEKLRVARYAFSEQEVRQYFPEDAVLAGLFGLAETLYGVRIAPAAAPVWHKDVRFFDLCSAAGEPFGHFYVDLYARETKRGGAWMDDAITRRVKSGRVQHPVAYLNCNFSRPPAQPAGRAATFTHDEVITLFHEFGHGLHHLLTRMEDLGAAGINGVEWDAVELPSQFMENFCWEWEVVSGMTRHVESGERLPRELFDRMRAAKNFHAGLAMLRQIEFSLFDMRLHTSSDPVAEPQRLLDDVRREVAVLVPPAWNRFAQSFSHIFAGGYAAGYYSYKWAEVLSADAYGAFEEAARPPHGVIDPVVGARFRDEVLAVGGSRPAAESFAAFRGRAPRVDALLRHNGMISA